MTQPQQTTLQCSNCGTPNQAILRRVIDAQNDPQGKNLLLNGQVNSFRCANCQTVNSVSSPLLYHDGSKELLIAFVPMDVATRLKTNEEKIIGDLMNDLTKSLDKKDFRAYMFNPKRALTMQGLIEQIVEGDGVTRDMIEEQKKRVELLQSFLEAESEAKLVELVKASDDKIDMNLFQTLALMGQRVMEEGQQALTEQLMAVQEIMLVHTSFGQKMMKQQEEQDKAIQEIAESLDKLDENASRSDLIDIVVKYADSDRHLQAIVGMARTALDYQFFLEFSQRIEKANGDEAEKLTKARNRLQELAEEVDEHTKSIVQEKTQFLRMLLEAPQFEAMIAQNMDMLDDNFMRVLAANLQEAKRLGDEQTLEKMTQIYDKAVDILQSQMTPELRFINDLLGAESPEAMQKLVDEKAQDYDDLNEVVDAIEDLFKSQGQDEGIRRLGIIREALNKVQS